MVKVFLTAGAVLAPIATAGCHCTTEYRSVAFNVSLGGAALPGDSIAISLSLHEFRGSHTQQSWNWFIDVRSAGDSVIVARVVDPDATDPERRVLAVLTGGYYPYRGIFRSYGADPYRGTMSYEDLWDRMESGRTAIEIELASSAPLMGLIVPGRSSDWHPSCTD